MTCEGSADKVAYGVQPDSEQRLKTILDSVQVGIVVVDKSSMSIVDANKVAVEMLGVRREEILGSPCRRFFCHKKGALCPITELGQSQNNSEQMLMTGAGKKVPILKTVASVELGGKDQLLESFLDISELKHAQKELERANRQVLKQQRALIEEERVKVLLQMAGATAHELNQPLTALLGKIELMKLDKGDPKKLVQHIPAIEQTGRRILEIAKKIEAIRHGENMPGIGKYHDLRLDEKLNILCIEDSETDFAKIGALLKGYDRISLFRANTIAGAVKLMERAGFDLTLSEHVLSDGISLDFLEIVNDRGLEMPVVVITGHGNEMIASRVIQCGAYDYLPKDMLSKESLTRSISNALEKSRLKREIGMAHRRMADMSTRDPLTGLYNRRYFMEALEREVARASRYRSGLVLCMLDLDHFKLVNDTYGHPVGDRVLSELSGMLKDFGRESDLLCRYGGEEFAIILANTELEQARMVCERFRQLVGQHQFRHNDEVFHVTVSMGMAAYDRASDQSALQLVGLADDALYAAKDEGRNRVVAYVNEGGAGSKPRIGRVFISQGFVTEEELGKALSEQRMRIGETLVLAGRISLKQLRQALTYQKKAACKVGEALRKLGHATNDDILWALRKMKRKLGQILRDNGVVTDEQVQWALAVQRHDPRRLH